MLVGKGRPDHLLNNLKTKMAKSHELGPVIRELAERHDCSQTVIVTAALWHFAGLEEEEAQDEISRVSITASVRRKG